MGLTPVQSVLPDALFHVSSTRAGRTMAQHGLLANLAWVRSDIAAEHARLLHQAGHRPLVLSLPLSALENLDPQPDWEALDDPPLDQLWVSTETLNRQWTEGDPTWQRSVLLVGSMRTAKAVSAELLTTYVPIERLEQDPQDP